MPLTNPDTVLPKREILVSKVNRTHTENPWFGSCCIVVDTNNDFLHKDNSDIALTALVDCACFNYTLSRYLTHLFVVSNSDLFVMIVLWVHRKLRSARCPKPGSSHLWSSDTQRADKLRKKWTSKAGGDGCWMPKWMPAVVAWVLSLQEWNFCVALVFDHLLFGVLFARCFHLHSCVAWHFCCVVVRSCCLFEDYLTLDLPFP